MTATPYIEATAQLALADAIHDGDDTCNANYYIPATECPFRETDIEQAAEMIEALRKAGWRLVQEPENGIPISWPNGSAE